MIVITQHDNYSYDSLPFSPPKKKHGRDVWKHAEAASASIAFGEVAVPNSKECLEGGCPVVGRIDGSKVGGSPWVNFLPQYVYSIYKK